MLNKIIHKLKSSELYRKGMELVPPGIKPAIRMASYDITNLLEYRTRDMFKSVAIETTSVCNRRCGFCPNSDDELRGKIPQQEMEMELYKKIVEDLAEVEFKGSVSLQHFGEPLLDSQLEERISFTREHLPEAYIMLRTNGDFLTPLRYEALVRAGIDEVFVTDYSAEGRTSKPIEKMREYLEQHPGMRSKITIRKGIKTLSNRGGLVPIPEDKVAKDDKTPTVGRCIQESYTLNIDVKGNVVMCSNDYLGQHRFGSVEEEPIMAIWKKPAFKTTREQHKRGVFYEEMCKKCMYQ